MIWVIKAPPELTRAIQMMISAADASETPAPVACLENQNRHPSTDKERKMEVMIIFIVANAVAFISKLDDYGIV